MPQNVLTDRLSLAISLKFPKGDIIGTTCTLVAKPWVPEEIFVRGPSTIPENLTPFRKLQSSHMHMKIEINHPENNSPPPPTPEIFQIP